MHFYESSIITTVDGIYCQVYSNEHPEDRILVKPKYIPTDKISSEHLPSRFISGKRMNRLNLWIDKDKLKQYIDAFAKAYPEYVFKSPLHEKSPLFFAIPKKSIGKFYSPIEGLANLVSIPNKDLDEHLKTVVELVSFLLESGLSLNDLGITYSTLMGHYSPDVSDINMVVYGKNKFWKLMEFLEKNPHKDLRWKTYEEWEEFYKKRNRNMIHKKEMYIKNMYRKKSEGFFKNKLFVIFGAENKDEVWHRWGEEKYNQLGTARFEATVENNKDSIVRPGCYEISSAKFLSGRDSCRNLPITKVAFYSRDYCMLAYPGEKIEVSGVVEEVTPKAGGKYYRAVIGYLDSYLDDRRDKEYIRVISD